MYSCTHNTNKTKCKTKYEVKINENKNIESRSPLAIQEFKICTMKTLTLVSNSFCKHTANMKISKVQLRTLCEYQEISKGWCEYSANVYFSCEYATHYSLQDLVCMRICIMFATILL